MDPDDQIPRPENITTGTNVTAQGGTGRIIGLVVGSFIMILTAVLLAVLALTLSEHTPQSDAAPAPLVVNTPVGRIQGVLTTSKIDLEKYVSYKSIPFAKPPIGDLRFHRPLPLDQVKPQQIINSRSYQKSCWSVTKTYPNPRYGEDCLYLNVYVPHDATTLGVGNRLKVMVYIHTGGFVAGSTFPEPAKMVTRGQVIVVTVNYRMGAFGFLTTDDGALPSNNGLWDQYMALKWVKDNIYFFQGDNSSITVFGESAGSMSTSLHVISPVSSGLFHKAILQSGAVTSPIHSEGKERARVFGTKMGCGISVSNTDLADCLRRSNISDILLQQKPRNFDIPLGQRQVDFVWMPVIDGELIPRNLLSLLTNQSYLASVGAYDKDYLLGVLNDEGAIVPENFLNRIPLSNLSDVQFVRNMTRYFLNARYGDAINEAAEKAVYSFYTGFSNLDGAIIPQNILDLAGDLFFYVPTFEMASALSWCHQSDIPCQTNTKSDAQSPLCPTEKNPKVFLYYFDYCPATDPCDPPCMYHGADIALEFPRVRIEDPTERQLSDIFLDLLTTFAKTSNPGSVVKSGWPEFEPTTHRFLKIDTQPTARQYFFNYRMHFWLNTVPTLL